MNKKLYTFGVLAGAAALMAGTAMPASAAAGDTTTTFALAGSTLSITVQPTAALTNGATGASSVGGPLGLVKVTDLRGGTVNWSANATSTAFTGPGTPASSSTGVSYNAGTMTTTGTITILPGTATTLNATPAKVAGPTMVLGNNTAEWNPVLTVSLPSSALAGDYTGTVNTSVS